MMTPGLDATLIGSLETMQADSTDFLCLSSFQHNFALLSWLDESTINAHWKRLALSGSVMRWGATNGHGVKPRIFYVPLTNATSLANVLQQLEQIQNERSIQTVNIMLNIPPTRVAPSAQDVPIQALSPKPIADKRDTSQHATPPKNSLPLEAQQQVLSDFASETMVTPIDATQPLDRQRHHAIDREDEREEWEALDRLVDDLDAFKF